MRREDGTCRDHVVAATGLQARERRQVERRSRSTAHLAPSGHRAPTCAVVNFHPPVHRVPLARAAVGIPAFPVVLFTDLQVFARAHPSPQLPPHSLHLPVTALPPRPPSGRLAPRRCLPSGLTNQIKRHPPHKVMVKERRRPRRVSARGRRGPVVSAAAAAAAVAATGDHADVAAPLSAAAGQERVPERRRRRPQPLPQPPPPPL